MSHRGKSPLALALAAAALICALRMNASSLQTIASDKIHTYLNFLHNYSTSISFTYMYEVIHLYTYTCTSNPLRNLLQLEGGQLLFSAGLRLGQALVWSCATPSQFMRERSQWRVFICSDRFAVICRQFRLTNESIDAR